MTMKQDDERPGEARAPSPDAMQVVSRVEEAQEEAQTVAQRQREASRVAREADTRERERVMPGALVPAMSAREAARRQVLAEQLVFNQQTNADFNAALELLRSRGIGDARVVGLRNAFSEMVELVQRGDFDRAAAFQRSLRRALSATALSVRADLRVDAFTFVEDSRRFARELERLN